MKATLTATYPPARFGALKIINDDVKAFEEKPKGDGVLINGGFFVLNYDVLDYIEDDSTVWERTLRKTFFIWKFKKLINIWAFGSLWIHLRIKSI